MDKSIGIVVIAYNRNKSLERLLSSISEANIDNGTTIIISIDKSNNPLVEQYANKFDWKYGEKKVVSHKKNLGLRKHILGCGNYLNDYDAIIVLEDDLVVSKNFFSYAKQAVYKYYDIDNVAGISLYSFGVNYQTFYPFIPQPSEFDTYFMMCAQSWGQVWMKKQWKEFEQWYKLHLNDIFDQTLLPNSICSWSSKSWLKYHTRYCIETKKYFVYPYVSLTSNCGETGTHLKFSSPVFQRPLAEYDNNYTFIFPELGDAAIRYDGFFEAESIYSSLSLAESELCIDLSNSKKHYGNKRYLLTTKSMDFKVVRSFGLSYTPIELNVIKKCEGNMIFLYDIRVSGKPPKKDSPILNRQLFAYENKVDIFAVIRRLLKYGVWTLFRTAYKSL